MTAALRVGYNEAAAAAGLVLETMKRSSRSLNLSMSLPLLRWHFPHVSQKKMIQITGLSDMCWHWYVSLGNVSVLLARDQYGVMCNSLCIIVEFILHYAWFISALSILHLSRLCKIVNQITNVNNVPVLTFNGQLELVGSLWCSTSMLRNEHIDNIF